jgi:hypothetical protein
MEDWELVQTDNLDCDLIEALFENRIGAVKIQKFLPQETVRAAVRGIQKHGFDFYENVEPPIGRIGITQFEHREHHEREKYFAVAARANQRRRAVLHGSGDILQIVLDRIGHLWKRPVGIAVEADGREYFAGLTRIIGEALLHCDWAQHDAPGWAISAVNSQITWNLFCSVPAEGGATVVHNQPWNLDAERFRLEGSYGYDGAVVAGCGSVRIEPAEAALVLFNSRNFHRVEAGSGDGPRITVSSFIGRLPSGDLVAWS